MSTLNDRWGADTIGFGFTAVPNLLLRINALEGTKGSERLTAAELFVLLVILSHWINYKAQPHPGIERIARYTGLSGRHVRRIVKALADKNYLVPHRHGELDGRRNSYSPRPLVERLRKAAIGLKDGIDTLRTDESVTLLEIAERLGLFTPPDDPDGSGAVH